MIAQGYSEAPLAAVGVADRLARLRSRRRPPAGRHLAASASAALRLWRLRLPALLVALRRLRPLRSPFYYGWDDPFWYRRGYRRRDRRLHRLYQLSSTWTSSRAATASRCSRARPGRARAPTISGRAGAEPGRGDVHRLPGQFGRDGEDHGGARAQALTARPIRFNRATGTESQGARQREAGDGSSLCFCGGIQRAFIARTRISRPGRGRKVSGRVNAEIHRSGRFGRDRACVRGAGADDGRRPGAGRGHRRHRPPQRSAAVDGAKRADDARPGRHHRGRLQDHLLGPGRADRGAAQGRPGHFPAVARLHRLALLG